MQEKHGRHLVKIDDTHQEEVVQVGESSQATMATPISDEIAQKIFKEMEEQSDILKKMRSRLTKLEEARLKKPNPHVEVLNDEEVEDWDERDKANYERNNSFGELCDCGNRIEYAINNGKLEKGRASLRSRRHMEEGQPPLKHPIS
ncbi:hypothetical protein SO802_022336 [Lithocarpus litseifolius]|uniref:Uncharacterized protein n=1 Tax=Lithocarpus litseifolius TaxID=425828 RepID=A0AAW2CM91_9ROSI